jgi:Rieske 2Fe-2S family protein
MQVEKEPARSNETSDWTPRPTLSGTDYTSLEVYEQEREHVWWGDWVCVGRAEDVPNPGDYLVRNLAGESIFITRNDQSELRAFYNVCSHRGTRFVDGPSGSARKVFVCPYHSWSYDLNGCLVGSPNVKEDEAFDRSTYSLHAIAVEAYAGFLFVNLAEKQRPLLEQLTSGAETITAFERFKMDELRVGVRLRYEVDANWKILVENYNECLHCPTIHPELVKVVPLFRFGEEWDEQIADDGNRMIEGATSFTKTGHSELPKLPGLNPEDYEMYFGMFSFPNLMLNLHPDCGMYYIVYPNGPGRSTVISEFLFRPETIDGPDFKPEPVVEFWDLVSTQDWEVCRRAQTGVGSRAYTTGIYPRQDRFLYWFNEQYRAAMGRPKLG